MHALMTLMFVAPALLAAAPADFKPYTERIPGAGTDVTFEMLPIPGGKFLIGSPADEPNRKADEGPQVEVEIEPFWMAKHEVTWAAYQPFMQEFDRAGGKVTVNLPPDGADAVSVPSPTYEGLEPRGAVFGKGQPAQLMTHYAARQYTKWLSLKTGRFYRLPTEAEWEYAARAGSRGPYSFGAAAIDDHAWHFGNANDQPHPVGLKQPNAFGLHDMHGNVAEWVFEQHAAYGHDAARQPLKRYGQVVRGGSFLHDAPDLRSAARLVSTDAWQRGDPELPTSLWWLRERGAFVGMRIVRPFTEPAANEKPRWWEAEGDWAEDHQTFTERGRLLRVRITNDEAPQ